MPQLKATYGSFTVKHHIGAKDVVIEGPSEKRTMSVELALDLFEALKPVVEGMKAIIANRKNELSGRVLGPAGLKCPRCDEATGSYHKPQCLELHMQKQAAKRPPNFCELPPREQWEIDDSLGILDYEGF